MKVFRNKIVLDIIVAALSGLTALAIALSAGSMSAITIIVCVLLILLSSVIFPVIAKFRSVLRKGFYGNYDAEQLWIWELWRQFRDDYFRNND